MGSLKSPIKTSIPSSPGLHLIGNASWYLAEKALVQASSKTALEPSLPCFNNK